ncbi:MAG: sugar ABC transporter ATP-binding protein [Planctomycetota bacterium]|nr:sugar ABC transporter ATP-binding protein [Planctomycetota bacterium]
MATPESNPPLIEFDAVTKTFSGVTALHEVSLPIRRGECHALMGENGAGKSTLGKILAGIHGPDGGSIRLDGRAVRFNSPRDARLAGVGMVHQELAFCPDLSVAENLALGRYPRRAGLLVDRRAMEAQARTMLDQVGADIDVRSPMRRLSTAQEQLVQIASAVGAGARVIVFDEPTSSLAEPDAQRLFELLGRLRARGVTLIYVSHRMPEVLALCDRMTVLRDGRLVGTLDRAEATSDRLVEMMIGRALPANDATTRRAAAAQSSTASPPVLRVRGLASAPRFADVSFDLRAGEILGLAGLVGSGRSEIARTIFGLDPRTAGEVEVDGKPLAPGSVDAAMAAGIGLAPEDRKRQGLVLNMSGLGNFSLAMLGRLRRRTGLLDHAAEKRLARDHFARLDVRTPSLLTPVATLSGGNQQKIVLARWLARDCRVLIVDEPTRGVDVGAKLAIHELLRKLAASGAAVLLISSELPELLALADRVLVMREGRTAGELLRAEATQDRVLRLMAGVEAGTSA